MKHYLKLVNFEFNRFLKVYLALIGITIISQIVGVFIESNRYLSLVNHWLIEQQMSQEEVINNLERFSLIDITSSSFFLAPIVLCVATLLIYCFLIWYRDWFGKNTVIYRLLMLPIERINIYFAKATTILIYVLGLIALQIILLTIEGKMLTWLIPDTYRLDLSVSEVTRYHVLSMLIPNSFTEFFMNYFIGMMIIFVIFTWILFERSFRWKGILMGLLYSVISLVICFVPFLLDNRLDGYFYTIELFILVMIAALLVIGSSFWLSHYLLKNKITV